MNRRFVSFILSAVSLLLVWVSLAPNANADEHNKKTVVTFDAAVQVPGAVLPAGTYVFKLADNQGDRNIVQIFDAGERNLLLTIMAIPNYHATVSDKATLTLTQPLANEPEVLQTWFYPGSNYGQEFVYGKQKPTQLAKANGRSAPASAD